jgi:protease PrsW
VITATLAFVAGALLAALSGVIGDEVRGWLELAPRGILRLVALRLPAGSREAIYDEEWLPELVFILHEAEGGPITRAARATWFAISLAGAAAEIGRALGDGRNEAEAVVHPDVAVLAGRDPTAAACLYISVLPVD